MRTKTVSYTHLFYTSYWKGMDDFFHDNVFLDNLYYLLAELI